MWQELAVYYFKSPLISIITAYVFALLSFVIVEMTFEKSYTYEKHSEKSIKISELEMKISESLCLDHFFVVVPEKCLSELKKITKKLNGVTYKKTKVKNDSWEGLYIKTNSGEYVEFLRPGRHKGAGVAFSSRSSIYADVRKIKNEFKNLKWHSGTRIWESDNSKWFTWTKLKPQKKDKLFSDKFLTWAMFYHPRYHQLTSVPAKTRVPNSFARLTSIKLKMNPSLEKYFLQHLKWSTPNIKKNKNGIDITVRNQEYENFIFHIEYDEKCEDFIFCELVLETHRSKKIEVPRIKHFTIDQKDGCVSIRMNDDKLWEVQG